MDEISKLFKELKQKHTIDDDELKSFIKYTRKYYDICTVFSKYMGDRAKLIAIREIMIRK